VFESPRSHRVLLLEDDPAYAYALRMTLEDEGWETRHTADLETFGAQLRDWKPHVVIIDLMVPPEKDREGLEAARRAAKIRPGCKRLILTNRSEEAVLDMARGVAHRVLQKNIEAVELVSVLRDLLGVPR